MGIERGIVNWRGFINWRRFDDNPPLDGRTVLLGRYDAEWKRWEGDTAFDVVTAKWNTKLGFFILDIEFDLADENAAIDDFTHWADFNHPDDGRP